MRPRWGFAFAAFALLAAVLSPVPFSGVELPHDDDTTCKTSWTAERCAKSLYTEVVQWDSNRLAAWKTLLTNATWKPSKNCQKVKGWALDAIARADGTATEGNRMYIYFGIPKENDVEGDAGAHRVYMAVLWDDYRSTLPFAVEVGAGDLTVFLPKTEDADESDLSEGCRFTSARMAHGNPGMVPANRADTDCLAPPAAYLPLVGIEYTGSSARMACLPAARDDGIEDPAVRYFACYWSAPPNEGGDQ